MFAIIVHDFREVGNILRSLGFEDTQQPHSFFSVRLVRRKKEGKDVKERKK